jgi:serine/threonine protein kinase
MSVAFRTGEMMGPYQVQQLIGRGSFGMVLLARDSRCLERQVALKIVPCDHLEVATATKAREAALAEADMLQRLRHPNIVSCYEVCWDSERAVVWLSLDYMDGGDLQTVLNNRRAADNPTPLEASFVRRVFDAIGNALRFVHSEGILHRDVKPGNMLLSRSDEIKLADFGVAKLLEATTNARTVIGTPLYMAPEMVSGQPYGPASDAWALGICLYEFATLRRPFEANNQLALARQIVDEPFAPLPEETASDLKAIICGLLEKDWNKRYPLHDVPPKVQAEMQSIDGQSCSSSSTKSQSQRRPASSNESCQTMLPKPVLLKTLLRSVPVVAPLPVNTTSTGVTLPQLVQGHLPTCNKGHGTAAVSLLSPRRLFRGDYRSNQRRIDPSIIGQRKEKTRRGARVWFSFLRPARHKDIIVAETTETTTISAFEYNEDDASDDETSGTRRSLKAVGEAICDFEASSDRPAKIKAWQ